MMRLPLAKQEDMAVYGNMEVSSSMDISQKIVLPSLDEMGTSNSTGAWNIDQNTGA
ncbi:MAG: hypothetical protein PHG19_00410 [Anaerotignum sp.]|nr:hypothetical protein [Anaerotignum sp.]